jgi:hypothetical protein
VLEPRLQRSYGYMLGCAVLWIMAASMATFIPMQLGCVVGALVMGGGYLVVNRETLLIWWCDYVARHA